MKLVPSRRAAWIARSLSGHSFIALPVAMPSCEGMSGKSFGLTSTRYLLSPPRVRNRTTGMDVTSTTLFSSAVSAPLRLPSAVICTSPCLSPACSITSTPIISPSDFGLLMPNFLPLRSAAVLSGESGMTIITRSANEREVMLTILTSCPCSAAAMTGAAEIARHGIAHRAAAACAGDNAGDVEAVLLEEALLECDAVWRAGGVVLVLGNEEIGGVDRARRRETHRRDQDDAPKIHYHVPS